MMKFQEKVLPIEGSGRVISRHDSRIGSILVLDGKLETADIDHVMELQRLEGMRFGEAAQRLGLVTPDDVRSAVARQYDLPHLLPGNESVSSELVVAYAPFHPRAEELRALRTQLSIRWSNARTGHRALAIMSAGPGEGRSYVAANLAVAFALLGERTLLIDADLRNPRQHRIFNIPDRIGLSAILSGRADRGVAVPVREFAKLSVLPAGAPPPNPQELLSRAALGSLLQDVAAEFDVVLVDTSPARPYADSRSVAFRAGSAIVIARKDYTRMDEAREVIREMGDAGIRVVGTVFNVF